MRRKPPRSIRIIALAGAAAACGLGGFVLAALLFAGPDHLREVVPIGSVRNAADRIAGSDHGRDAQAPQDIPARGWIEVVRRVVVLVVRNRLMQESAAVAFYTLLAIFPALAATVSIYGLVADPAAIQRLIDALPGILPAAALGLLHGELDQLIRNGPRGLSIGVAIGLATTLWSANQGSKALFDALNVIYREPEKRSYPYFVIVAMAFTFCAILFVMAAMIGVVALPQILEALHLPVSSRTLISIARWPAILALVALFLAGLYRFGPSRENAKWRWVTWGSGLAALSWIGVSLAFSWYVQSFGSFDRTYGSLGAGVGFMVWIWLSTLVALCGAQLNSELEHQTSTDTTTGDWRLPGMRGAKQADTVA